MTEIIIRGQPEVIGLREAKALLRAVDCILNTMGFYYYNPVIVSFKSRMKYQGEAYLNNIDICKNLDFSDTAATIIHEMVHVYLEESNEYITSTLASKIKTDVIDLANFIVVRSQKWAAFRAHLKISYEGDPDTYNRDEDHREHMESKGKGYRQHRRKR